MDERTDSPAVALGLGLALVAALTALDVAWGPARLITATVVLGPFLAAIRGRPREVVVVGVVAIAVAVVSAVWNENLGELDYFVRAVVVIAGSAFAVVAAQSRERIAVDGERFRLLAAAAEIGDEQATVDEVERRVEALLVPAFADVCAIGDEPPPELAALGKARRITVELRARSRRLGAMTLAVGQTTRRRFTRGDHEFLHVLGGRVALALDNAGLSREVESLEARMTAALGSLAEAVTIQGTDGRLIYANDAAARALGFDTPEALLATPPQEIVDAFIATLEDGSPLRLESLPGRRVLAGEDAEPVLVRAIHRQTGEERWRVTKATAVHDRDGRPVMAVNVIEDVTEVKRAELTQRFLAAAGEVLASSLDYEETLARITRLVVPQLADWCAVSLPDGHGFLRSVAVAHVDPAKTELAREYNERFAPRVTDETGSAQVLRTGESQVINEIPDELLRQAVTDPDQLAFLRGIGMRAAMVVPMTAATGVIGTISFVSAESGRPFTAADVELAEELGRRSAAAVENARLYTERSRIAQTLQMSLLPDELPQIGGFELAALYRPAGAESFVGGDFYDAFATDRGWMVVVGDVTGRGAEAAALTAQARHTLRTAGTLLGDPVAAIEQLNRTLAQQGDLPICTVAALLLVETPAGTVARIACAGHPPPLLVRDDAVRAVGATGAMAGAWEDATWEAESVPLEAGDVLVLYTDGVIDAVGETGRFGEERLTETLRGAREAADVVARVQDALRAFERGEQADDTAVVALQRVG